MRCDFRLNLFEREMNRKSDLTIKYLSIITILANLFVAVGEVMKGISNYPLVVVEIIFPAYLFIETRENYPLQIEWKFLSIFLFSIIGQLLLILSLYDYKSKEFFKKFGIGFLIFGFIFIQSTYTSLNYWLSAIPFLISSAVLFFKIWQQNSLKNGLSGRQG